MKSLYNYIIYTDSRYDNKKYIDGKELIINSELSERDYKFVNRIGTVKSVPINYKTKIKPGDKVIVHHNVFRRWIDIRGKEKNSSSYIDENIYSVSPQQVYAYKNNGKWKCPDRYCFVKPLPQDFKWSVLKEKELVGELVYSNKLLSSLNVSVGDIVGFTPGSEYEFNIEDQKLYRILLNDITINYGRKKNKRKTTQSC